MSSRSLWVPRPPSSGSVPHAVPPGVPVEITETRFQGDEGPKREWTSSRTFQIIIAVVFVLAQLVVDPGAERQLLWVAKLVCRDDAGAERRGGIEVLARAERVLRGAVGPHLDLPVPGRDVVHDGETEYVLHRIPLGDVAPALADDDRKLGFVVQLPGDLRLVDDVVVWAVGALLELDEELGFLALDHRLLVPMIPVVLSRAQNDRGLNGREQLGPGQAAAALAAAAAVADRLARKAQAAIPGFDERDRVGERAAVPRNELAVAAQRIDRVDQLLVILYREPVAPFPSCSCRCAWVPP